MRSQHFRILSPKIQHVSGNYDATFHFPAIDEHQAARLVSLASFFMILALNREDDFLVLKRESGALAYKSKNNILSANASCTLRAANTAVAECRLIHASGMLCSY